MNDNQRLIELEKLILKEQKESELTQKIARDVFPILDNLTKSDVMNPVILKVKLAKIDKEYRDIIYTLFRLATAYGPKGSLISLSLEKILSIIEDLN